MTDITPTHTDRITVGLTRDGRSALESLQAKGWYSSKEGLFKAAVAYALQHELAPTQGGSFETIWNVGTLDRAGFLGTLQVFLEPGDAWDQIQRLGDAGLRRLSEEARFAEVPTEALLAAPSQTPIE